MYRKLLRLKAISNQKRMMYRLKMSMASKKVFSLRTQVVVDLADEEVKNKATASCTLKSAKHLLPTWDLPRATTI